MTQPGSKGGTPLGTAALLRCAADGELSPADHQTLEAHLAAHPEDGARIACEEGLRCACARVMAEPAAAPAHLKDTLLAKLSAAAETAPIAGRIGGASGETDIPAAAESGAVVVRRVGPSWLQRYGFAAAAVLVMSAGGLLLVRAGMLTTSGNGGGFDTAGALEGVNGTDAVIRLSAFLSDEHEKTCADAKVLCDKLTVTDPADAPRALRELVGRPVSLETMEAAGFEFLGLGQCAVPGAEQSAHMLFRRLPRETAEGARSAGGGGVPVSLFIERDTGRLGLKEGVTYSMCRGGDLQKDGSGGGGGARVVAWVHDGLVYYLVTRCSKSCDAARVQLHAPEKLQTLTQ